jgi:hypothetical protein
MHDKYFSTMLAKVLEDILLEIIFGLEERLGIARNKTENLRRERSDSFPAIQILLFDFIANKRS